MVHRATRPQCKRRPQPRGDSSIESEVEDNIEQDLFSLGASSHSYIGDEQPETDRKQRIRLDESVEHQLILDIDEAGGIKSAFSLVDICNSREHLFGAPSSPQRVRIQKRVDYWKSYPERYYFRRRDLGIRTVSAKKHQPQSPHVKAPVPNRREHKPFSPSPKKPPGANTSSGRPCRRQKEDFDLDRDERDRDEHDRDEHDRNEQFLHRFSELKLNMASARFSLANDLAVDPETKDRVRGTYG